MAQSVMELMTNNTDSLYDQPLLRHRVEDHLTRLRQGAQVAELTEQQRWRYENDLYNLLYELGYPRSAYYAILRLNGMTHPGQLTVERSMLLIPNHEELRWLHDLHEMYRRYNAR